jgi:hypothetical protein
METDIITKVELIMLFSKNVELLPTATTYVSETWELLCVLLEVDPNAKYENAEDIVEKSPLFKKQDYY